MQLGDLVKASAQDLTTYISQLPHAYTTHLIAPPIVPLVFLERYKLDAQITMNDLIAGIKLYPLANFTLQLELAPILISMLDKLLPLPSAEIEQLVAILDETLRPRIVSNYLDGVTRLLITLVETTRHPAAIRLLRLLADTRWNRILDTNYRLHVHLAASMYIQRRQNFAAFDTRPMDIRELTLMVQPAPTARHVQPYLIALRSYQAGQVLDALEQFEDWAKRSFAGIVDIHIVLGLLNVCHHTYPHGQRAVKTAASATISFLPKATDDEKQFIAHALIGVLGLAGLDHSAFVPVLKKLLECMSVRNVLLHLLMQFAGTPRHPLRNKAQETLSEFHIIY